MTDDRQFKWKLAGLLAFVALGVTVTMWLPPIPQDPAYHQFADQREFWGIPNFWNVLSNLPFLVVGLLGGWFLFRHDPRGGIRTLWMAYAVFFAGVALVALGSAYYHVNPSNESLFWDRLPMTVAFMAFFAAIIGEYISPAAGARLLWPLVALGILSVAYWHFSEVQGMGDLRPYAVVQFLPLILTPVILVLFPSPWVSNGWIWLMLGAYLLSKGAEVADAALFDVLGVLSGHSLKHLLASAGGLGFLAALVTREPVARDSGQEEIPSQQVNRTR